MGGVLKDRWLAFVVALGVRCVIAFVFFGSVDVTASISDAEKLIGGRRPSTLTVPYLPGVQLVIWTAGVIGVNAAIPFAFLFKFPGSLFDSVIAALIADARGRRAALLYAFAPVQLLVFGIHGQWDSISLAPFIAAMLLLRREGDGAATGAGALAVLSVVAKPITAPFLLFLIERKRLAPLARGAVLAVAAYGVLMWAVGDPLVYPTLQYIARYASGGIIHLGLPIGLGIPQNRLMTILPLLVLVPLYARGRISREQAATIGYAFILGTCGLSAQYLAWLLPFLLLCGYERFGALYGVLAAAVLTLFYAVGYEGTGAIADFAFAPLRVAAWLAPARTAVAAKADVLIALGNFVFPAACLWFAVWSVVRHRRRVEARAAFVSLAPLLTALAITAVLFAVALALPHPQAFAEAARERMGAYAMEPASPKTVDAVTLAWVWIAAWGAFAAAPYLTAMRARR